MKGYSFPFPFDRSYKLIGKNKFRLKLYYGVVHYSSPQHVIDEVGQKIIMVEREFTYIGNLKYVINSFTSLLFKDLELVVVEFWNQYPEACVQLSGTKSNILVSSDGLGYWDESDYVKLKYIPKNELKYLQW